VTSLERATGHSLRVETVEDEIIETFAEVFGCEIIHTNRTQSAV